MADKDAHIAVLGTGTESLIPGLVEVDDAAEQAAARGIDLEQEEAAGNLRQRGRVHSRYC